MYLIELDILLYQLMIAFVILDLILILIKSI